MAKAPERIGLARRRETSDASAKTLWLFAAALVAAVSATLALAWLLYIAVMESSPRARATDDKAWSYAARDLEGIVEAREAASAESARRLERYEWIDREAGVARIPIERALRIAAEQGLPQWGEADARLRPIDMINAKADDPQ